MLFSPTLRIAGRTAVAVLSNIFGLEGELYYPKEFESARAGYDDEIEYSETPDWTGKFLAPFVFGGSKAQFGGFFDELNGDEKAIYFDDRMVIPINSLVVFKMPAGEQLYRVYDLQSNNDEFGHIYTKCIVVPVTKFNKHTKIAQELNAEYIEELEKQDRNEDQSVEEFINDLLGKPMENIKEANDNHESNTKDIYYTGESPSEIKLDISDSDILG